MKKIYVPVLFLGAISPAFGVDVGGIGMEQGSEIIGDTVDSSICGCSDWPAAEYLPENIESICSSCNMVEQSDLCISGQICDDGNTGNLFGVIVGTKQKLVVNCGTWVPEFKEPSGVIREGYWSVAPSASCETVETYKCGAGYYGTPTSARLGCVKCPSYTLNAGMPSSESPRKYITNCYIKANSTGSDETGDFTLTDACFYAN